MHTYMYMYIHTLCIYIYIENAFREETEHTFMYITCTCVHSNGTSRHMLHIHGRYVYIYNKHKWCTTNDFLPVRERRTRLNCPGGYRNHGEIIQSPLAAARWGRRRQMKILQKRAQFLTGLC